VSLPLTKLLVPAFAIDDLAVFRAVLDPRCAIVLVPGTLGLLPQLVERRDAPLARATKDLDLLGQVDNSLENLERVVREVCAADVEPDGMVFDPATVKTERIKEDADYEGMRVRFVALLGRARVTMQIDVGFGDVVTPGAETITYPALLDFPAPGLLGAEKFQAIVYLRTLNSRMKDFYDVWLLASQFAFDGALLAKAIAATFANRQTDIALSMAYPIRATTGAPAASVG